MKKKILKRKTKEGAASFYIVIFATLILMVVATSFAAVIVSEVERTSNDDLSQSAYDAALAGVEDAKSLYMKYMNCIEVMKEDESAGGEACTEVMEVVKNPEERECNMWGDVETSMTVENNTANNMQEEYTCVKIKTELPNYSATLSASNPTRVVKARFDNGVHASDIETVKISWYNDDVYRYENFSSGATGGVKFPSVTGAANIAAPPTISLALIQTAGEFELKDFDTTVGDTTDRGMVYLVPSKDQASGSDSYKDGYKVAGTNNYVDKNGFLVSNKKEGDGGANLPYVVYCPEKDEGFACSATVQLPQAVNGARSDETFAFVVGVPYGTPTTRFEMEFYCASGQNCGGSDLGAGATNLAVLNGPQLEVDSTGRANDLFRRVIMRLEDSSDYSLSILGPLELLPGNAVEASFTKTLNTKEEWNFKQ